MISDFVITAGGLLYAAVVLAATAVATTAAYGIYDSIESGNWTPGYVLKRDIGVLTKNLHPGAGNRLQDEYLKLLNDPKNHPRQSTSAINQGDAIAGGLFLASFLGGAAGAGGSVAGATDSLGNAVPGASVATGVSTAQLGSEIAQATFESADAFNAFHQPFTQLAAIKDAGLQNIGSTAVSSGAAAGKLSIGVQGGNAGLEASNIAADALDSTSAYVADAVKAPVEGFAKVGPALKTGWNAAKDSIALPFEKLGDATHPLIGKGAQSIAKNVSTNVLQAAVTDEDVGDAALIGAASGLGSFGTGALLSGSNDLASRMMPTANAHPSTIDPLRASLGKSLAGLNSRLEGLGGDLPRTALAKELSPEVLPYQIPDKPFSYEDMFPFGNKAFENRSKRFPSVFSSDLASRLDPYRRRT